MSVKQRKKHDVGCISATVIALLFCLYAIAVNLTGIKEAKAAVINKQPTNMAIVDSELAMDAIAKKDSADKAADDEPAVEDKVMISREHPQDAPSTLKKTVVLLDTFDKKIGEVCFEAIDDSVFMSYGWVGLAERALVQTNEDRKIDDIKMEFTDNCDEQAGEPILLSYNPIIASDHQEDF